MLAEIWIEEAVQKLRPDFVVLAMTAEGLVNAASDDTSTAWLRTAGRRAAEAAQARAGEDPHVLAWRDAYRDFGAKPQRTRPSVDALLRSAPWPVTLIDLFTSFPRDPDASAQKTALASVLMAYARSSPQTIRGKLMPVIVERISVMQNRTASTRPTRSQPGPQAAKPLRATHIGPPCGFAGSSMFR